MKDLIEIITEIKEVWEEHLVIEERITALKQAGFDDINYRYLKGNNVLIPSTHNGLYAVTHLPKKHLYRIKVGYTEFKKGYPVAWCVEVSDADVKYVQEQPF